MQQHPQYPQPQQPAPQRSSGANVGVIVAIVGAVFVVVLLGIFVLFGVLGYMRASRAASLAAKRAATPASFTESYSSPNGLVTAHYPADWAAKSVDEGTLTVTRNLSDGGDELVYVAGIDNPISNDVNEIARILLLSQTKTIEATGDHWTETARRRDACLHGIPGGLRVEGTFRAKGITKENVRLCFLVHDGHAYATKTMVPAVHETEDLALLESMVQASDIK